MSLKLLISIFLLFSLLLLLVLPLALLLTSQLLLSSASSSSLLLLCRILCSPHLAARFYDICYAFYLRSHTERLIDFIDTGENIKCSGFVRQSAVCFMTALNEAKCNQ